jgi:hypothetical protein
MLTADSYKSRPLQSFTFLQLDVKIELIEVFHRDAVMQVRDQLIQETEGLSEPILIEVLDFVQGLKERLPFRDVSPTLQTIQAPIDRQALIERVEYLETVLGIQKGLASFDRGEGIPVDEALDNLRQKFNIPSRS